MAGHNNRGWDESKSPQWRYLLGKEAELRRATKRIFRGDDGEDTMDGGEIKRNKQGKKKKSIIRTKRTESAAAKAEKLFTKQGKEIIYSASPGRHSEY
jgi:hypothetical protein